jgi:hypothetical protein
MKVVKVKASKGKKAHVRKVKGAARSVNYGREIEGMKTAMKDKNDPLVTGGDCDNKQKKNPKSKAAIKKVNAKVK